ncbi:hypothetical protein TNCV_225101 [Trichonephila clavipes]|nr:hypothetical protein TNCV_225101 [Trichonephila clavipes]
MNISIALFNYTRVFGYEPRHFESGSSDEDDTRAGTPRLLAFTPPGGRLSFDRFNVNPPTQRVFSGTRLMTRLPRVHYLDH